jgi:KDO2-lipid IV(A) lauroyltransferase
MMILADQQLREGDDVPFFGHPARTAIAHFKIAAKTGVPIYFAQTARSKGCHITVSLSPPLYLDPGASDEAIRDVARQMNDRFEAWIRSYPEQWLWPHRRWGKKLARKDTTKNS